MRLEAEEGVRLDVFLASRIADESRSSIAKAIDAGTVTVDGIERKASYKLSNGEVIHFEPHQRGNSDSIEAVHMELSVPYEDEYLLVVDKPAGLSTHPSPTSHEPTLVNALLGRSTELSDEAGAYRPGIVHRLDKDTSGLLVVAKGNVVHRKLQAAIQRREVENGGPQFQRTPGKAEGEEPANPDTKSQGPVRDQEKNIESEGQPVKPAPYQPAKDPTVDAGAIFEKLEQQAASEKGLQGEQVSDSGPQTTSKD